MRQQQVTISANPADVQQEADRIAQSLREQGNTVTASGVFTIAQGHKAGMPAVMLTIEDPVEEVEAVTESVEVMPSENDPESWKPKHAGGRPPGSKNKSTLERLAASLRGS